LLSFIIYFFGATVLLGLDEVAVAAFAVVGAGACVAAGVPGAGVAAAPLAGVVAGAVVAEGVYESMTDFVFLDIKVRLKLVAAKTTAVQRVAFCTKVVAPVAPNNEFDPPPPPKDPPKESPFES
jgi:hypothetical protein